MFKHILVPLDFTRKNARALKIASDLASSGRAKLTLIHVIEVVPGLPVEELRGLYRKLEESARTKLRSRAAALARRGIAVREKVVLGQRVREILNHAIAEKVDLIVLSSHRVNVERRGEGWGTISYKVGILAPCPVLLVK